MSGEQMSGEQMSFGERMSLGEWERLSPGINRPGTNVRERMSGERLSLGNKREGPVNYLCITVGFDSQKCIGGE